MIFIAIPLLTYDGSPETDGNLDKQTSICRFTFVKHDLEQS